MISDLRRQLETENACSGLAYSSDGHGTSELVQQIGCRLASEMPLICMARNVLIRHVSFISPILPHTLTVCP